MPFPNVPCHTHAKYDEKNPPSPHEQALPPVYLVDLLDLGVMLVVCVVCPYRVLHDLDCVMYDHWSSDLGFWLRLESVLQSATTHSGCRAIQIILQNRYGVMIQKQIYYLAARRHWDLDWHIAILDDDAVMPNL